MTVILDITVMLRRSHPAAPINNQRRYRQVFFLIYKQTDPAAIMKAPVLCLYKGACRKTKQNICEHGSIMPDASVIGACPISPKSAELLPSLSRGSPPSATASCAEASVQQQHG